MPARVDAVADDRCLTERLDPFQPVQTLDQDEARNKRLPILLGWLHAAYPNAVFLRELRCTNADFPIDALRRC
jgi:hypothetical protein